MDDTLTYRIGFASVRGMNRTLALQLLALTGGEKEFFILSEAQLGALTGRRSRIFSESYRHELLEKAQREADFVEAHSIRALYFTDPDYPMRLNDCDDAPLMLYASGVCDINRRITIGIVGTRHATPYGLDFTERLVADLSEKMVEPPIVVSGLAFGIDVAAHRAALRHSIPTIAILAHGLNTIYPSQHRSIAAEMARGGGMLLTDYGVNDPVHKGNFIARNRIVAGLSDCLVVVESAIKGGAMATAEIASAYNRDVFALPGRISDRFSAGCNSLISRNTAAMITGADSLIQAMNWTMRPIQAEQQTLPLELDPKEEKVVTYLTVHDDVQINRMAIDLDMEVARLTALLIEMEFKGLVSTYPGARYRLGNALK